MIDKSFERLKRIYKITKKDQKDSCDICGRPFPKFRKFQDHFHGCCHPKKKEYCGLCTRGQLCFICNKFLLGYIEKKNVDWNKVAEYLNYWEDVLLSRGIKMRGSNER